MLVYHFRVARIISVTCVGVGVCHMAVCLDRLVFDVTL